MEHVAGRVINDAVSDWWVRGKRYPALASSGGPSVAKPEAALVSPCPAIEYGDRQDTYTELSETGNILDAIDLRDQHNLYDNLHLSDDEFAIDEEYAFEEDDSNYCILHQEEGDELETCPRTTDDDCSTTDGDPNE